MPLDIGASQLLVVLVLVAIYVVPVWLVLRLIAAVRGQRPDPRAVLAERLARGEISREEFDTAMRALGLTDPRH